MELLPEIEKSVPRGLLAAARHEALHAAPQLVAGALGWAVAQEHPRVIDVDVVAPRRELQREQVFNGDGARDATISGTSSRSGPGLG